MDALHTDVRSKLDFADDAKNASKAKPSFLESSEVQILLRAVCNNPQFLCDPDTAGCMGDELYPTIKIKTSIFVVHNYGDRFDRIYQSHIQNLFHAFPQLNEENRIFFWLLVLDWIHFCCSACFGSTQNTFFSGTTKGCQPAKLTSCFILVAWWRMY
jgi:hypothetical protein